MRLLNKFLLVLFLVVAFASCKKWDDHTEITDPNLTQNLLQAISGNSELSKFREYLAKTGLDTVLQSSKNHTVWAPTNAALQSLDPAIVNDNAKLKSFLLNHISLQSYFTHDAQAGIRVGMLNGKFHNFTPTKFEDATLVKSNQYVRNGVLHVIDKPVHVLPSVWDFINSTTSQYNQNAFIAGLNFETFDPSLAIVDSISFLTGLPVYRPGTGIVTVNRFNERVFDLRREDRQYTYFVIADPGFTLESDSLKSYFTASTTAETDSLARWYTVQDLVVEGLYEPNMLPAALTSRFGVTIPINPTSIVDTQRVSNGIVYVLNNVDVLTSSKFREIMIEGENPSGFLVDRRGNTNYRVRTNPVTGEVFNDIMISGHGVTSYYVYYRLNELPTVKYRVYGSAVNDFQTGGVTQNVVIKSFVPPATYTTLATLPYAVPLSTAAGAYNEKLLGEFTPTTYGTIEIQLTSSGTNPLVLDYLRLVPVP